ncbi:cytosine permease [Streptomyces sp. KL116D]|uniref:cytosine permease n=1 Tax=Streptomyces sp. KL116D TaxID=3045152 RepID=UPI00355920F4
MLVATSPHGSSIAFLSLLAVVPSPRGPASSVRTCTKRRHYLTAPPRSTRLRTSAYWYKGGFSPAAVIAWAVGLVSGLRFTSSDRPTDRSPRTTSSRARPRLGRHDRRLRTALPGPAESQRTPRRRTDDWSGRGVRGPGCLTLRRYRPASPESV